MSILQGLEIAASGLRATRTRMNTISSNMANAESTRTPEGGAYRRRQAVTRATPVDPFNVHFDAAVRGVEVAEIQVDEDAPLERVFDPGHPDADAEGFVEMPNVEMLTEMVDMMATSRGYEANATAFDTLKRMAQRAIQIGD